MYGSALHTHTLQFDDPVKAPHTIPSSEMCLALIVTILEQRWPANGNRRRRRRHRLCRLALLPDQKEQERARVKRGHGKKEKQTIDDDHWLRRASERATEIPKG